MHPIYTVDYRTLDHVLGNHDPSLRREITQHIARNSLRATTWQEAINTVSGATENRSGQISFWTYLQCPRCRGRMVDMRMGRWCTQCRNGRVHQKVSLRVDYQEIP